MRRCSCSTASACRWRACRACGRASCCARRRSGRTVNVAVTSFGVLAALLEEGRGFYVFMALVRRSQSRLRG
ncbi:hypothetical protein HMPREF1868_00841 [Olsenella sp. DNF00959]|nr:hypothetical protein HMPREF1868_00841 [Olsenella sp. DNF00959]